MQQANGQREDFFYLVYKENSVSLELLYFNVWKCTEKQEYVGQTHLACLWVELD